MAKSLILFILGDRARFPLEFRHRQTGMRAAQTPQRQSRCSGKVQKDCILQSDICYLCKLKKISDMNKVLTFTHQHEITNMK